jgi:hypothetical protein
VRGTFSIARFHEPRDERIASAKIYREGSAANSCWSRTRPVSAVMPAIQPL